jgi:hypothetical protein
MKDLIFSQVKPVYNKAISKGYFAEPPLAPDTNKWALFMELLVIQLWLRKNCDVHLVIDREAIGSDEWVFVYRIQYLPAEFKNAKRRAQHVVIIESLQFSGGATYMGGWDDYEEAMLNGVDKALDMVP